MSEWISVEESLPEFDLTVLGWQDVYQEYVVAYRSNDPRFPWVSCEDGLSTGKVSHWLPLPKPPTEDTK